MEHTEQTEHIEHAEQQYLSVREVAEICNLGASTVRRIIISGALPAVVLGGSYRVDKRDFDDWIKGSRLVSGKLAHNTRKRKSPHPAATA